MKKRTTLWILFIQSILWVGLSVLTAVFPDVFPMLYVFPFKQIAMGLQAMADLGPVGSGFAMFGYALLSLLPIGVLLIMKEAKKDGWKIASLLFASVSIAVGMIGLIDIRWIIHPNVSNIAEAQSLYYAIAGLVIWSGILLAAVVFVVRDIQNKSRSDLFGYADTALYILLIMFYMGVCTSAADTVKLIIAWGDISDVLISVLSLIFSIVGFVFNYRALSASGLLIDAYRKNEETSIVSALAKTASRKLSAALMISASLYAILNLIKLIFAKFIQHLSVVAYLPLFEIGVLVLLLFIAKVIEQNSRLTEDNNMFI